MSSDDGRTVAVPLTQEQAINVLQSYMREAWGKSWSTNHFERMLDAILSASPDVLAAAMGGRTWTQCNCGRGSHQGQTAIVLPSLREGLG